MGHEIDSFTLESILEVLPDRLFVISESGIFLKAYGGTDSNINYPFEDLIGMSFFDLFDSDTAASFHQVILDALKTNEIQRYTYTMSPDNFPRLPGAVAPSTNQWYEGLVRALSHRYRGEQAVVWIARNVTEHENLKQRLTTLSEVDDLTKVLNKRAFSLNLEASFKQYQSTASDTALLILDIDHFKPINDAYGHLTGDEVLKEVARILSAEIRAIDHIGRIGGEEFAIILTNSNAEQALSIAERIRLSIRNTPVHSGSHAIKATISVGISEIKATDSDSSALFLRADKALYHSKNSGRDQVNCYGKDGTNQ